MRSHVRLLTHVNLLASTTLLLLAFVPVAAQTYTPKQIIVRGAGGMDTQEIIAMSGLKPGPMTKQEIEAGLQHVADSGFFDDLSYTVSPEALILTVTPTAATQLVPVRFTNFVWWTPKELNTLIQARVPLYQGKLSLKGQMLEQVKAALVDILKQKGIDGEVTEIEGAGGNSMSLAISRPVILLGTIDVHGSLPVLAPKLADMKAGFAGQEFDQQVDAKAVPLNTADLYHDAGYLDATTDPATFASPRMEKNAYLIDASTTIHPGELYRIHQINFSGPPALSNAEMEKAAALKPGDPAGVFPIQHAADSVAHAYYQRGYLDARASADYPKDASAHTVNLTFTVIPGDIYHLAGIDASRLSASAQASIARDSKLSPGVVFDQNVLHELEQMLAQQHVGPGVDFKIKKDPQQHLASLIVAPSSSKH